MATNTAAGLASVRGDEGKQGSEQLDFTSVVTTLRNTFNTHRTKDVQWRIQQLKQLEKLLLENCDSIIQAIKQDMGRPEIQALLGDVSLTFHNLVHFFGLYFFCFLIFA
jgi:aldehyde dehydrogenase (NAD+)